VIDSTLINILTEVFSQNNICLDDSIDTIDVWDSMLHMELIIALEESYSIRIEPEDIVTLTGVKSIQDYLNNKGLL
jgi:acyl carrier protein|tara:strand:- start:1764 stop:1991 length:228 start_codon:yes stop_codon:yes gene_type:complete